MEKLLRMVIENTAQGNIDKQTAAKLLQTIKNTDWKPNEDIAVIGVSFQLPHVRNQDEFWEGIANGVDFIGALPESRRADVDRYLAYSGLEDISELNYLEGAFLEEVDKFDYQLFRLSPKEASLMDPYQRLFLQTAWSAIEDAGYGGKKITKSNTGVFVGYAPNAKDCYQKMILDVEPENMAAASVGNVTAMLPSRIAYLLDLKGPTMVLDTACSSALVSVHLACQALKNGDCDMAIAGSVRMNLLPFEKEYLKFGLESSDGRTRTFDDLSSGAGMGEGVLAVMLKPLSKAIKDRDNIYGVVKGSALNQDGASIGITAPNPEAQTQVILKAWKDAGIDPTTLAYIEAHGTGTVLGDPLELDGLERAFRQHTDKRHAVALGSLKTNLGHLFESAGLGGFLKGLMILKNRKIPPTLYFNRPNTKFNFVDSPFYINSKLREFESEEPMRLALSSFGFSGTNSHLILEEAPTVERSGATASQHVFTLSARTLTSLRKAIDNYVEFLQAKGDQLDLGDICYTASSGRGHYNLRLALIVESVPQLLQRLQAIAECELSELPAELGLFGEHRIVPPNKEQLQPGEITERSRSELTHQSGKLVQAMYEEGADQAHLLLEIQSLYAQGADVAWDKLYQPLAVRKVSLPGYAFDPHRCWIDVPEGQMEKASVQGPDMYFTMNWKPESLATELPEAPAGAVLIFHDEKGIGADLADRYRQLGRIVYEVKRGEQFSQEDERSFVIGGEEGDYVKLLRSVPAQTLGKVVHLFSIRDSAGVNSLEELEETQTFGVYSLFYFTRAVAKVGLTQEIDVVLLAEYGAEVTAAEARILPENDTLFGMGKVVRKEHSNLVCRAIDIDEYTAVDAYFAELQVMTDNYQVAYRTGQRFVEEFSEIDVTRADDIPLEIRENGVYVITGGTGGIGLEVARYLAGKNNVHLILLNRTPMPEREHWAELLGQGDNQTLSQKIINIQSIEAMGSTIQCFAVDVADRGALQAVLEEVRSTYGRIHGVVHGAGVGGAVPIVSRTPEGFRAVFNPKVQGTWNLHEQTLGDGLDFMLLFSSIASLFSAPGQGDYIAANQYLDAFVSYRNKLGLRTTTVNWSTWRETGMSVHHDFTVDTLFKAIMTRDAIAGMDTVLNKRVPRALIGEVNFDSKMVSLLTRFQFGLSHKVRTELEKRMGNKKQLGSRKTTGEIGEARLTGRADGDYNEFERIIGTAWARVLGFEELNIYDNFYELGGDSILGLRIANTLNEQLGVEIGVADLLSYLTIADFAAHLTALGIDPATSGQGSLYQSLQPVAKAAFYPASSTQKRLFLINELEGGQSVNYNITKSVKITGPLDVARLESVFGQIIERHETLRTTFALHDGEPVQYVQDAVDFAIEYDAVGEGQIGEWLAKFIRPFRLDQAPLSRIGVIKTGVDEHILVIDLHHIITDGVSMDILIGEFAALYQGREVGALPLQYRDYAVWQHQVMQEGRLQQQEEYWLNLFSDQVPVLNLPTDHPRPAVKSDEGHTINLTISEDLRQRLYGLARETGSTLYMLLLSSFNVLLSKYAAQEDIVIGTPIVGRPHKELEGIVGMFVNTLVLRNYPRGELSYRDFLNDVRTRTLQAVDNQDYPLEEFVSKMRIQRDRSRNPLFDVYFVLQNVGNTAVEIAGLSFENYEFENTSAKFDLMLEVIEREAEILVNLNYCTKLYEQGTAERMLADYLDLLEQICTQVDQTIESIELASVRQWLVTVPVEEEEDVEFNF